MTRTIAIFGCLAALLGAVPAAFAQANPPASTPTPPFTLSPEQPPSSQDRAIGRQDANRTLGSRLAQTNGTLHPPAVDPGMQKTPTQPGTMPVIPPPGTPGGAPGAVAK